MRGKYAGAVVLSALLSRATALDDVTSTTAVHLAPIDGIAFSRGDANQNGAIEIGDAISALGVLFASDETSCLAALDANGDRKLDIADPISLLDYLFAGGAAPPPPFGPAACGPLRGDLSCDAHRSCEGVRLLYEATVRNEGAEDLMPPIRLVLIETGSDGIEPANADGLEDGKAYWEIPAGGTAAPVPPAGSAGPIDLAFRGEGEPALSFRVFARTRSCALYSLRLPAMTRLTEKIGIYRLGEGTIVPQGTALTGGEGSPAGPPSLLASSAEVLAIAHGATTDLEVFRFISHGGMSPIAPPVRPVGGPATALAVDAAGDVAVGSGAGTIEIFRPDPEGGTLPRIVRLEIGSPIHALAAAAGADGDAARILYAGVDGAIARARGIEDRWEVLAPHTLPAGAAPGAFAWAGGGEFRDLLALDRAKGVFVLRANLAAGTLSLVPGSPFSIAEQAGAIGVVRDEFVYVAGEERIFAFRLLSSGSLAIIGRLPIPEGVTGLAPDCEGTYLYGTSPKARTILVWRIGEDGALAEKTSIRDSHPDYVPGPFSIR